MSSCPVLLFKEPSPEDTYESLLKLRGYEPKCVPVIHTIHANLDALADHIVNARDRGIEGAVITSKRSCDSLSEAFALVCSKSTSSLAARSAALEFWSTIPFYVVGEATASAVRDIQQRFQSHGFSTIHILGEASGTGEQLGRFITTHCKLGEHGKLLYLTGNKNRDTVASILSENYIPFQALRVYETQQRPDFESLLEAAIYPLLHDATTDSWWTVYFAPSTASFAIPAAEKLLKSCQVSTRIATIGPVTTASIEEHLNLPVLVTASKPDAQSLAEAISEHDRQHLG
ncbi:tetrapyrrole biosynthesis, uroporphyrinogen III synthase [Ephemerocybe angulata]|uniref:Tetrapyrrole biosynthesis, uroporphyrinogen III synthase n=1 Tax=Ephemerocybe angulata TaxID=980116 RepID=A0A8H6HM28_9AGAR|nr:tetrapyrrole biosynthesis, uroporphyrinogen III synthase [Tulosesus angulatus]